MYCTVQDVRTALTPGGVTDDQQTGATLPDWQIEDAIAEAEGFINAYLTGYSVILQDYTEDDPQSPGNDLNFTAAPAPLRRWTRNVAAYLAALTFRRNKDLTDDDPIVRRYNLTLSLLNDVRSGVAILPPDDFPPSTDTNQVEVFNLYEGTLFGPEDFDLAPLGSDPQVLVPRLGWWWP